LSLRIYARVIQLLFGDAVRTHYAILHFLHYPTTSIRSSQCPEFRTQRRKDLTLLRVRKTRKEQQRDDLKSEITALNTSANTEPAAFTDEEVSQLTALQNLIARYIMEKSPSRPLCLAVFGPPGSGKSYVLR
jgi:DNA replication protein DnaC